MKGIDCYLGIIIILILFFCVVVIYLKYSKFSIVPGVSIFSSENKKVTINESPNVTGNDSRYSYPYEPPVNPIVLKSILKRRIPVNSDSPINKEYSINDSDYSEYSGNSKNNLLNYSGGNTELLKIPLQMNEPNSFEQLRSQDILITPYNRIKYSNEC